MICPALGSRNLVRRLNTVVLPAPFGPISAWMVPRRIWRSTPCTAVKPRNSFVNPRVSRIRSSKRKAFGAGRTGIVFVALPPYSGDVTGATEEGTKQVQDQIENALAVIRFGPDGLVPAIAQQYDTGEILMLAWMNREAVRTSLDEGRACYWSRSRAKLWRYGAAAGRSAGRRMPHRASQLFFPRLAGWRLGRHCPTRSPAGNSLPGGAKRALIGENYVERRTELFARGNGSAEPDPSGNLDRRSPQERPDDNCRGFRGQGQGSARPGADRLRRRIVVRQRRLRPRRARRSRGAGDA